MKILIADDERLARKRLRVLLAEHGNVEVVAEAANGREALERAAVFLPDTVLLDIAMPVLDGLETARHLAAFDAPPAVVFCTAYDEHALTAFEVRAIDYLIKPVRREQLAQALARASQLSRRHADGSHTAAPAVRSHLVAKLRGTTRMIAVDEIFYLQSENKYTVVHHLRGRDLIEDSLRCLEQEFGTRFVRIHRNCLVARKQIREIRRAGDGRIRVVLRDAPVLLEASRRSLALIRRCMLSNAKK